MKKKIRFQLFAILSLAIIIMAVFGISQTITSIKDQSFDDLIAIEGLVEDIGIEKIAYDESYINKSAGVRITWIDSDGIVLYDNFRDHTTLDNHISRPEITEALDSGQGQSVRDSDTLNAETYYYAKLLDDGTILRISKDYQSISMTIRNTGLFTLALAIIMILISYVLAGRISDMLVRPLRELSADLGESEKDVEVYEEIEPFIRTIKNQHIDLLKASKLRQEFTANVTHELKTPLTVITGYSELLSSGLVNEEDVSRIGSEIYNNAENLHVLIEDILNLSHLDQKKGDFENQNINLELIAKNVIENLQIIADRKEVEIVYQGNPVYMMANSKLIEELYANLITNAINYNLAGGKVYVKLFKTNHNIVIEVRDTGIGISESDQKRIFERFYRADKSRSKEAGGTGLGLAIVKHIVAQYNGEIKVESAIGQGTTFRIVF